MSQFPPPPLNRSSQSVSESSATIISVSVALIHLAAGTNTTQLPPPKKYPIYKITRGGTQHSGPGCITRYFFLSSYTRVSLLTPSTQQEPDVPVFRCSFTPERRRKMKKKKQPSFLQVSSVQFLPDYLSACESVFVSLFIFPLHMLQLLASNYVFPPLPLSRTNRS